MRATSKVLAGLVALVVVGSWLPDDDEKVPRAAAPQATASAAPDAPDTPNTPEVDAAPVVVAPPATRAAAASPAAPAAPAEPALLQAAPGGDGDSWRDTAGREYRLGMVNTPEVGECYAEQATAERKRLTGDGFRADVYSKDRYGRAVAVVSAADGTNINVHLARHGLADDRYLAQFRHENPALGRSLDAAFAAAKQERAGLWSACRDDTAVQGIAAPPPAAAPAAGSGCHPDYATCIPVKGDGSGRGEANDLDCGDIGKPVQLRQAGTDPYRLDGDGDGVGCDS